MGKQKIQKSKSKGHDLDELKQEVEMDEHKVNPLLSFVKVYLFYEFYLLSLNYPDPPGAIAGSI